MQYITIFDYLLLPVYLYIFYFTVKRISIQYTDTELRKYYFTSFYLHMSGAVAYALMVQYYYGYGDSFVFFYGSNFLSGQVGQDASNIKYFFKSAADVKAWYDFEVGDINYAGYFGIASNLFVMKISAFLSVFSFNKYLIITLFFGLFSFAGLWRLFLVFKELNGNKEVKLMAWSILYMPSVWFWGSGLIKDSICIGGIGFIIYSLHKLFIKKEFSLGHILWLIALVYIVGVIKSYIIIVLAVGMAVFIFYKFVTPFKNIVIRGFIITAFLLSVLTIAFITNFSDQLQLLAEESMVQVDSFKRNYEAIKNDDERSVAALEIRDMDMSPAGMLMQSPMKIFTCLFRPFIWESGKIFVLFSAFESLLMLICTIYIIAKLRVLGFFRELFKNPFVFISFVMALLFALIIGFTTYNFGTMARYKIILMPFYFFMLVACYTAYRGKQQLATQAGNAAHMP